MNLAFSRYLDEPLTQDSKRWFASLMGLDTENFSFVETVNDTILRQVEVKNGEFQYSLSEKLESEWEESRKSEFSPFISLRYQDEIFQGVTAPAPGVWETLLPFPLKAIHPLRKREHSVLRISDPAFSNRLIDFALEMDRLEARLNQTELGCLLIRNENARIGVLFHFVRKRILATAILPQDWEGWSRWEARELSAEGLRDLFGTTATLIELDASNSSELQGLTRGMLILKNSLDSQELCLSAGFASSTETIHFPI